LRGNDGGLKAVFRELQPLRPGKASAGMAVSATRGESACLGIAFARANIGEDACQAPQVSWLRALPQFYGNMSRPDKCRKRPRHAPYYCIASAGELWFERLDFGVLTIWPGSLFQGFAFRPFGGGRIV
jgi:hypothetical protein